MRGRIEEGYRHRFRELLALVRPRRLDFGVELLLTRAREKSEREALPLPRALALVYEATRARVRRRLEVTGACSIVRAPWDRAPDAPPPRFLCDESLGGLARWLRADGYEAEGVRGRRGDELLREAREAGLILLTSDSHLFERRLIRDGQVRAVWVPTALTKKEQLALVVRDLGLRPREARCMACGGALVATAKETVRARIPPRTARWKDEYFLCARCDRLFWQGTHWERISSALAAAGGS